MPDPQIVQPQSSPPPQPLQPKQVKDLAKRQTAESQYRVSPIPFHIHNNLDSPAVDISDISRFPASPAQGDVLYYNAGTASAVVGANKWVNLAAGTSGLFLQTTGTSCLWAAAPAPSLTARVHGAADVSVPNNNVETTVATLSNIPAMGANDMLQFEFFINLDNNNQTSDTARIKWGSTTIHTFTSQNSLSSALLGRSVMVNLNSTSSQRSLAIGSIWQSTVTTEAITATAATSTSADITFTYQIPAAGIAKIVTVRFFNVRLIRG